MSMIIGFAFLLASVGLFLGCIHKEIRENGNILSSAGFAKKRGPFRVP